MRSRRSRKFLAAFAVSAFVVSSCGERREAAVVNWNPNVEIGPIAETGASRVGSFGVRCGYTHTSDDDPIIYAGEPGLSHTHDFFGAVGTDAFATTESLGKSPSLCDSSGDLSAYWTPSLYADESRITPIESAAYYRALAGSDLDAITVPPNGLKMLSVGAEWTCARVDDPTVTMPQCPDSSLTRLLLAFPDCWDGKNLDSADHRSHVTASEDGACPESHPVAMTRLILEIRYKIPVGAEVSLASGDLSSAHGDAFINWRPEVINQELKSCVKRSINCDLTWNTTIGY